MKIYLVGYMGSGKSTLAKEIAKKIGYRSIDLDEMIEKETRKTIDRVFEEKGEEKFRAIEKRVLYETKRLYNIVVATGGGAASFEDNMDFMNTNGITLYLKVTPGALFHRLSGNKADRPLLKGLDDIKLMEQIQAHLAEREPLYMKAKHIVKSDAATSSKIIKLLNLPPL